MQALDRRTVPSAMREGLILFNRYLDRVLKGLDLDDRSQLDLLGTLLNLCMMNFLIFCFLIRRLTALVAISAAVERDKCLPADRI